MWTDKQIKAMRPDPSKKLRKTEPLGERGAGKLMVEVQPNGIKNFYYQAFFTKDGKTSRQLIKLGRYKETAKSTGISLTEARSKALELASQNRGEDLKAALQQERDAKDMAQKQKDSANITLQEVLDAYIADKDLKQGTIDDYRKSMRQTFSVYLDKPLSFFTRDLILQIYRERSAQSVARANNAMRVFRALYNYQRAVTRQNNGVYLLAENPIDILRETKVVKKVPRKKTHIPKEHMAYWLKTVLAFNDYRFNSGLIFRDYLIFILFTGVRREEARQLKKADVDLKRKTFRLVDTKNREVVELPLSDWLAEFIKPRMLTAGEYLFAGKDLDQPFNGIKRPLAELQKQTEIPFTLHDLRRTFITVAESLDISTYTIKRLVNHKINENSDVTAGYVMVDIDRMRAATNKITKKILNL